MANALVPFIKPFQPNLAELPDSLNTGMKLASNAMALRDQRRQESERVATENALAQNPPEGLTGATADLANQGMGMQALKLREYLSKLSDEDLKRTEKKQEKLKPIVFSAYSRYEDILAKTGDKAKADAVMQQYWPEYQQAWIKAGGKQSDLSPTYNHAETMQWLTVDDMLKKELYTVREKAITTKASGGGGKGASEKHVQLSNFIQQRLKKPDGTQYTANEALETATWILSNPAGSAAALAKAGYSQEDIQGMLGFARSAPGLGKVQDKVTGQRTGRSAKDKSGNTFFEMSDGSWKDAQGKAYGGK